MSITTCQHHGSVNSSTESEFGGSSFATALDSVDPIAIRYLHHYTYACDDVQYKRKDNPDAWITVEEIGKEMFSSYPVFSFIPGTKGEEQPVRYGDFVIDIDTKELACKAARTIIDWFRDIYGVEPEQWRVCLSGKKGVHLELPATILGVEDGHVWLPLAYKILAMDLEAALSVELDISMYNKGTGKPFRRPNVMRDTGTCKRQIDFDDLYEIEDEEDYREACKEPGDIWQPEDTSRNASLADKISGHLKEAEQQQEAIKLAPKLTGDELDRLINERPGCITVLAGLKEWTNGKTFNDIAIQLTAYAVTAGISENDLLAGAKNFITYYPSSSLNTLEKRYENIRARYRTMAANGNAHSCGGILALKVPGFDCSTCNCKTAGPQVTIEDVNIYNKRADQELKYLEDILNPPGMLKDIADYYNATAVKPQPLFAVAAGLILGSILMGRRYNTGDFGNYTSLYFAISAKSGTGKDHVKTVVRRTLKASFLPWLERSGGFTAANTVIKSLERQPLQLVIFEELGIRLKEAGGNPRSLYNGVFRQLLDIWSSCHSTSRGEEYSDGTIPVVAKPALTMVGLSTPQQLFEAMTESLIEQGFVNRILPFISNAERTATPPMGNNTEVPEKIVEFCRSLWPGTNFDLIGGGGDLACPGEDQENVIGFTKEALQVLYDIEKEVVTKSDKLDKIGLSDLLSRNRELTMRVSLIVAVMDGCKEIQEKHVEWSWKLVDSLYGLYVAAIKRVSSGSLFEQTKKQALADLRNRGEGGLRASAMPKTSPWSRWDKKLRGEILEELREAGLADMITKKGKRGPGAAIWVAVEGG